MALTLHIYHLLTTLTLTDNRKRSAGDDAPDKGELMRCAVRDMCANNHSMTTLISRTDNRKRSAGKRAPERKMKAVRQVRAKDREFIATRSSGECVLGCALI
jgi:hypothetical protein